MPGRLSESLSALTTANAAAADAAADAAAALAANAAAADAAATLAATTLALAAAALAAATTTRQQCVLGNRSGEHGKSLCPWQQRGQGF